ncbi:type II secretion system F family protein [Nocardioides marmorisolisilvae]|uniref:Type II secretion system protein n=1 Tax=Nocardioides marmorisolisilvae TaxID=1542737 RepID=A0A3N0E095_9ACTN|nr:type II secretion system F family protein [Nocardioides marmorisolisilvae]RNL81272.1 type II secretion system protein [Nocardioides marmorisolisilvae]
MSPFLAGLFASAAVAALVPLEGRLETTPGSGRPGGTAERALLLRLRGTLCILAAVGGWAVVGGVAGWAIGVVAALLSWRALSRLESPAAARRRRELERDVPIAVHLLAACLAAGAATVAALETVATAMPGAAGDELDLIRRRLQMGVDAGRVWRSVDGPLEELGRRMARAHESGASVEQAVTRLAEDLLNQNRARAEASARTVEVRAAAPLGLCFLSSFVLLGVVPLAAGLFSSLTLFR